MKIKTVFPTKLSFAVAAALFSGQVMSAGFQVSEHSASGLGRAFSGEGAVADNAAVLARNPAAMSKFNKMSFSSSVSFVNPEIDVSGAGANPLSLKTQSNDVAPSQIVPNAYLIVPLNEKIHAGMAVFTTYGVATEYPEDFFAGDAAGKTSLKTVNLNPSLSFQVSPQLSVGGGLNLVLGKASLTRYKGTLAIPTGSGGLGGSGSDKLIEMEGDAVGFGWNLGTLFEPKQGHRFALTYRSQVDMEFEGDFTDHTGIITGTPGKTVTGKLELPLASIAELSAFHQLNSKVAVHYGVMLSGWGAFKELKATNSSCNGSKAPAANTCFSKQEDYSDSLRYSVGGSYSLNEKLTLRAGLAYDEQAGDSTLSIPDTNRTWYAAGATWNAAPNLTVDGGYALVSAEEIKFTEKYAGGAQTGTFKSTGSASILSAQVNYSF